MGIIPMLSVQLQAGSQVVNISTRFIKSPFHAAKYIPHRCIFIGAL